MVLEIVGSLIPQFLYSRSKFVSDKNGVKIISKHDKPNGKIRFDVSPKQRVTIKIEVKNYGTNEIMLERYRPMKRCEFTFVVSEETLPVKLPPGNICINLFYNM